MNAWLILQSFICHCIITFLNTNLMILIKSTFEKSYFAINSFQFQIIVFIILVQIMYIYALYIYSTIYNIAYEASVFYTFILGTMRFLIQIVIVLLDIFFNNSTWHVKLVRTCPISKSMVHYLSNRRYISITLPVK
jgi:hypothetical protein